MRLSVIIPVHNGGEAFCRCLKALMRSERPADEVIVVDDGSDDGSAAVGWRFGAAVLSLAGGRFGPATARNRGAREASGDVLVFLDADVVVHADTLGRIEAFLEAHPEVSALFGSYDDSPVARTLVSYYKNLMHHYVHQQGRVEASTFWAGCGAVRREAFLALGGFDESYRRPSVEDIELGGRLRRAGHAIRLCRDVQVSHHKKWTLPSLLRSDILDRAVPWTRLVVSSSYLPNDLNLDLGNRVSAVAAWWGLLCLIGGFWAPWLWTGLLPSLTLLAGVNRGLYRFFLRRGGWGFALGAAGLHVLYLLYSSLVFAVVAAWMLCGLRR